MRRRSTAAGLASSLPPEAPTDSWDEAPEKLSDEEQRLAQALGVSRRLDWWTSSYSFDYYGYYGYEYYGYDYFYNDYDYGYDDFYEYKYDCHYDEYYYDDDRYCYCYG